MYERIRNLREDNDLSQASVAAFLGCSQVAYSYYEIGKRTLPLDFLCKLANFYNCSTDYLLNRTDEKKPYPKSTKK